MKRSDVLILCAVAAAAGYYFWKVKPAEKPAAAPAVPSEAGAQLQAQVGQLQAEIDAAKAVVPGPT